MDTFMKVFLTIFMYIGIFISGIAYGLCLSNYYTIPPELLMRNLVAIFATYTICTLLITEIWSER